MAVLKQIKFGNDVHQIQKSVVAINENSNKALSVVATNNTVADDADPTYTIALAVDGQTITKTGANGLATALALSYSSAVAEVKYTAEDEEVIAGTKQVGDVKTPAQPAKINLVDQNGNTGFNVLSSVSVDSFIGDGIVQSSSYTPSTGILAITFKGQSNPTNIDLSALLDFEDIIIKSDSTDYLSFTAVTNADDENGQGQIGVKLATVTGTRAAAATYYTEEEIANAQEGDDAYGKTTSDVKTAAVAPNLTVNEQNGSLLDAGDTITAVKNYIDDKVAGASSDLAVSAQGDNYITAAVDANNNKKINVTADVQSLTATAGTPGVYGDDGSQTTAPTAGTLSGTANSLGDAADIATKVKTYVDGAIAIEAARSDANTLAAVQALDYSDTAVAGQVVTEVDETNGVIAPTRANLSGITLAGMDTTETGATNIAATDTLGAALMKLQNAIDALETATGNMCYSVDGTTLIFNGIPQCPAQSGGGEG